MGTGACRPTRNGFMMVKVWKSLSEKRPRGAKLYKAFGILSAFIWLAAIGIFLALKADLLPGLPAIGDKPESGHAAPSVHAGDHAHGEAGEAAEAAHAEMGHAEIGPASHENELDASAGNAPPSREELAALRELAELHAASGDLAKAVAPMRRVMLMPTREPDLLALAAKIFLGTANYSEALEAARKSLEVDPADSRAKEVAVQAQFRLGRIDRAMADARSALAEKPADMAMLIALATMEIENGPGSSGYGKSLEAALKLKRDYPPALYLLGRKAHLEGDYRDAETAFRKVLKQDPGNAKARGQLGMALYHQGKEKDAEKEFRATVELNPADYNTWFNLGESRLTAAARELDPALIQSMRSEAMECYIKALDLNSDHAQAHYRVGVLLNGNGQYKEAISHLEEARKLDSRHVPTLIQLALAYEYLKQLERARDYLNMAFELDPLNKVVLFKLKRWS